MTSKKPCVLSIAMVALLGAPAPAAAEVAKPPVTEWKLANGLEVVHVRTTRAPVVTVQVWYRVGTRDEPVARRGMARVFERLMFQGSTRVRPGDHARLIDQIGGTIGAFTTEDATVLQDTVPSAYLDFVLGLEADRMRGLVLRKSALTAEKAALEQDRRAKIDADPVGTVFTRARQLAFPAHPYASTPPGVEEELEAVTVAEVRAMYDAYFNPNNAVLVIAGDVTAGEAQAAVNKHFAAISAGPTPGTARRGEKIEPPSSAVAEELGRSAEVGLLARASQLPPMSSDDMIVLRVLAAILGGEGAGARLPPLVVGRRLGEYATAQVDTHQDGGLFMMIAEFGDPAHRDALVTLFDEEVKRLAEQGVSAEELARGKNQLAVILAGSMEETSGLAFHAGSSKVLRGDAKAWLDDAAKYGAVGNDDIKRVAASYLRGDRVTLVVLTPAGAK